MSVDQIRLAESGGNNYAKNPLSSATGPDQFIDRTWLAMMNEARSDLTTGRSREEILAMRTDPQISREMTEAYANKNNAALSAAGLPVRPGTTYLAHFAGPDGAVKVLGADMSMPVSQILGPKVVAANPFLAKMTAGDLVSWADKKMGSAPAQAPQMPAQAVSAPPVIGGAPTPQNAPAAAPAPNYANMAPPAQPDTAQQPAQQPQTDPLATAEKDHYAAIKAAPMLAAPERPRPKADFSRLRMMLAQR